MRCPASVSPARIGSVEQSAYENRPSREPTRQQPAARSTRSAALFRWLPAMALVAVVALALAPTAQANVGETIILRCTHNESVSGFSQRAYNQALKELNADLEEYSPSCASLIREAQRAAAAGGRGGSGGGGLSTAAPVAVAATPSEQRALTHAVHAHPESVKLGSGEINPGVVHVERRLRAQLAADAAAGHPCLHPRLPGAGCRRLTAKTCPCRPLRLSARRRRACARRPQLRRRRRLRRRARGGQDACRS